MGLTVVGPAVMGTPKAKVKKVYAVACDRCPKCGEWMHLPAEMKEDLTKWTGHWQPVMMEFNCRCGHSVSEKVLCIVNPRIVPKEAT